MRTSRLLTVATASLMLAACQPKNEAAKADEAAAAAAKKPVATLNGKAVTQGEFDAFVKQVAGRESTELDAEQKKRALDSLISLRVLAAQAEKDGLHKKPDLAAELELTRLNILQQALAAKYLEGKTPTEQELKAEYDAQVAQMSRNEYRARHILVPSEIAATQILSLIHI